MRIRHFDQPVEYTEKQLEYYKKMYQMYDIVYRYFRVNVGCSATALDLTQDTYMKAWRILYKLDDDRYLKGWILSIAKNLLKDYFRKLKRDRSRFFLVEDSAEIEEKYRLYDCPPESDPERSDVTLESMIDEEGLKRILDDLAQMDEKYAIPLKLWIFGDLTEKEIAEITGVNFHTVRTRITRGRKQIARIFLERKENESDEDRE